MFIRHKKSGRVFELRPFILRPDQLPYAAIEHADYSTSSACSDPDVLDIVLKSNPLPGYKKFGFSILDKSLGVLVVTSETTWSVLVDEVISNIRTADVVTEPQEVSDLAFGPDPWYTHKVSNVVDTRAGRPLDAFPDDALVFVTMVRRPVGWKPVVVGYRNCSDCGDVEDHMNECALAGCDRCDTMVCAACKEKHDEQHS